MGHSANTCWSAPQRSRSVSGSNQPAPKGNSGAKPSVSGKVFPMSGSEASKSDDLIRGKCIIMDRLCDVLFDSGTTYSFVSVDCVNCIRLPISSLPCDILVSTPTAKPVVTSFVCLGCSVMVHDCKEKALIFGDETPINSRLQGVGEATAFMVLFSAEINKTVRAEHILVVQDFLEVFLDDVIELPPERKIEFSINLIPGASPVSIAPYRMSPVELVEVKKQVEELL
ncbi:uncharacterized protein LOC113867697 [Abrus precatorius]|uniref:Uncharacterized protein LOC113867697 n=1 Tax=Abrus precatorius TaxID=3816 RepID=A0A8B8LVL5_ABRPR|nr:uncharacterized protein LOC113867697 [Abrus precatorius]